MHPIDLHIWHGTGRGLLLNALLPTALPVQNCGPAGMLPCGAEAIGREPTVCLVTAGPLLAALGDEEVPACEGTAFYALQSCINHSCSPNAHAMKRDGQDEDGAAVILAKRDIVAGEELTISYIDEAGGVNDRAKQLAEYGFVCQCSRCRRERAGA